MMAQALQVRNCQRQQGRIFMEKALEIVITEWGCIFVIFFVRNMEDVSACSIRQAAEPVYE